MKREGFKISYNDREMDVEPLYIGDLIHYRVKLPGGDKFLRLEEKESKKLSWTIRGEGHTPEADILGKLIEGKVM